MKDVNFFVLHKTKYNLRSNPMKKITLLLVFLLFAGMQVILARTRDVSGLVTSGEDGLSIPGASIVVKGATLGTTSDMDGHFAIKVSKGNRAIVVSFVGFSSAEVALTGIDHGALFNQRLVKQLFSYKFMLKL